ncbi:uncharacterized protein MCYG_00295 [Microsporum canis CBS 113480]|uniref:Uncharacterized protein n=1 Tax=Arthroderma otae (strain ATCC MYA-4605 / CBS 113480) TaxID=554155 RepID=C5FCG3_ARTOC|nr:uncharacterized protein MCYG_00295 [Microsporum canis CBS 113480]EEQ27407.1 predicted protein [Microsporum canis CBS 113480]
MTHPTEPIDETHTLAQFKSEISNRRIYTGNGVARFKRLPRVCGLEHLDFTPSISQAHNLRIEMARTERYVTTFSQVLEVDKITERLEYSTSEEQGTVEAVFIP